ncbi:MAG: hypothetical protein EBZ17_08805 [Actinobacteria bacterium]|nr:hypothetical protein [Actinomycetota bacterium]
MLLRETGGWDDERGIGDKIGEFVARTERDAECIRIGTQLVGRVVVDSYDDSKATTPHATLSALRGFDRVVLIAGGRNKGIDLTPMASASDRVVAVVAIGDSADEIERAFAPDTPVVIASDMGSAVSAARRLAASSVPVLLSPGCASFDWYRNYGERGDDFARAVTAEATR